MDSDSKEEVSENKQKVLILDDDEDIQLFLKHELSKSGFECFSALNEQEAFTLLGLHQFTYAIFDIVLSSTTSSDKVIHYLQTPEAALNKNIPVCIMSAHMTDAFAKKVRLKGSNIFATFQKPLKDKIVLKALKGNKENAVLLVEDDPDMAKLIKSELEKNNFTAYAVRNTNQAIEMLKCTTFFGAIIDNQLEGETSQGVFDFLSNEALHLNLPLILTGTKTRQDLEENSFLFIFDHIAKPYKRGDFARSLSNLQQWQQSINNQESDDEFSPEDILAGLDIGDEDQDTKIKAGTSLEPSNQVVAGSPHEEQDDNIRIGGHKVVEAGHFKQLIKGDTPSSKDDTMRVKSSGTDDSNNDPWQVKVLESTDGEDSDEDTDYNKRNHVGLTPIMVACLTGDIDTVQYLVGKGAEIGLRCKAGRSCLHYAARSTNVDLIHYLLEKNIKVNIRDQENREPIYDAIATKRIENVKALLGAGSRTSTRFDGKNYLTIAVLSGDPDIVNLMLEQGLDPNFEDYKGRNALDYAKLKNATQIHQILTLHLASK
jgi:DNA-binding response OmpR family regulator